MIGDALVDLVLRVTTAPPSLKGFAEWLREVTRPPHGVVLHAEHGAVFTGLVMVKDNVPIAMVAMKTGERRAPTYRDHHPRPMFDEPYFYGDDEHG